MCRPPPSSPRHPAAACAPTQPQQNIRARHGHCSIDREDLIKPSHHSRIQFSHQFLNSLRTPYVRVNTTKPVSQHITGTNRKTVSTYEPETSA
eukprot:1186406-Prorocentrum_minimum.AAC.5